MSLVLDRAVRRAIRQVLLPIVQTPDFQARLAAAMAAEVASSNHQKPAPHVPPAVESAPAPPPATNANRRRSLLTPEQRAERDRTRKRAWARKNYQPSRRAAAQTPAAEVPAPTAPVAAPVPAAPEAAKPTLAATPRATARAEAPEAVMPKQLRAWLTQRLYASGMARLAAADRVAAMTNDEVLAEANARCEQTGARPFRLLFQGGKP